MGFIHNLFLILGRGIGQVMFQNNAFSGLLMLVGIFLNSWQMGILAICGNIISTLTAYFSRYKHDDIKNGLYGFNGTLVGIAVGVFLQLSVGSLIMLIITSALSTWIAYFFSRQRLLPGFTAPFILAVWGMLGVCSWLIPDLLVVSDTIIDTTQNINYFKAFCLGIGQVMFQGNTVLAGLFFLIGILVNSWKASLYTILGALLPIPLAILLEADATYLNAGLMGYNGVLCAIALGGTGWKRGVWAGCSVLLSTVLQILGMSLGIITLTAPFVISVWIIFRHQANGKT
ncbi:urea transporter [Bacteroides caecimuris]|uniref:urea transporter n=1 Tax=Bacteroides caecimuris TaxID=1796613 RepID=UPI00138F2E63|nr:urea transporter [Bacteroides caecimuris]NDO60880.1 urea transporter [Bacteroides caecimuris]